MADILSEATKRKQRQVIHSTTARSFDEGQVFREAGAIGIITIPNPAGMDIPWSRMSLNRAHPQMDIADPEFHELAGQKVALTFSPACAETLFAGSGHTGASKFCGRSCQCFR
jgi:hypothetical protein